MEILLFLPVLVLLVLGGLSATEYISDRRHVAYVTDQAARFATGAPPQRGGPRPPAVPPTPDAVAAYVAQISDVPIAAVTVTPDPTVLFPGSEVTVAVTARYDLGPLADLADALAGVVGLDQDLSEDGLDLNSTVTRAKR